MATPEHALRDQRLANVLRVSEIMTGEERPNDVKRPTGGFSSLRLNPRGHLEVVDPSREVHPSDKNL